MIESINQNPEGENWQFATGDVVRCELKKLSEGIEGNSDLAAFEKINGASTIEAIKVTGCFSCRLKSRSINGLHTLSTIGTIQMS